jgi:hypothetical protein
MQKHDLNSVKATISLDLLIQTAQIAVAQSRMECERELNNFQNQHFASQYNEMKNSNLAGAASNLAVAANTLYYLMEAKSRESITLI